MSTVPKWYSPIREAYDKLLVVLSATVHEREDGSVNPYFSIPYTTRNVGVTSSIVDSMSGKETKITKGYPQSFIATTPQPPLVSLILWLSTVSTDDARESIPCTIATLRDKHHVVFTKDDKPEEVVFCGVDYLALICELALAQLNTRIRNTKTRLESLTTQAAKLKMSYEDNVKLATANAEHIARLATLFGDTRETFLSMENGQEVWTMFCDRNPDAKEYQSMLDEEDAEADAEADECIKAIS